MSDNFESYCWIFWKTKAQLMLVIFMVQGILFNFNSPSLVFVHFVLFVATSLGPYIFY